MNRNNILKPKEIKVAMEDRTITSVEISDTAALQITFSDGSSILITALNKNLRVRRIFDAADSNL